MSSKTIQDLREKLFETLDAVKSGAMSIDQAKMISEISQTIINTAKVEVSYIQVAGGSSESAFLESKKNPQHSLGPMGRVVHQLRG